VSPAGRTSAGEADPQDRRCRCGGQDHGGGQQQCLVVTAVQQRSDDQRAEDLPAE
jgi:hypothetical protein